MATRNHASGRRRARLERQLLELELVDALLGRRPPKPGSIASLARLIAVFEHLSDHIGLA
jgi:hypothetical protein